MKIICDKYIYDPSTELTEVNYFSSARESTRERLDLYPYLLENGLSGITSQITKVGDDNVVYLEAGDVSLSLANTLIGWGDINNYQNLTEVLLTDYFDFYLDRKAIYEINIFDNDDNKLFTGILRKYEINFSDRTSEIINVNIKSLDKEFTDYYSQKTIPAFEQLPTYAFQGIAYHNLRFVYLSDLINRLFPLVQKDFQTDFTHFIHSYIMAGKPYIFHPCSNLPDVMEQLLLLKTGYESFWYDNVDAYSLFSGIIMSMGWEWSFKEGKLYIGKRSDNSKEVHNINYSDVLEHSIENELNNVIDSVVIDNGEWYGNIADEVQTEQRAMNIRDSSDGLYYYLGGRSKAVFSSSEYLNKIRPMRRLQLQNGGIGGQFYTIIHNGWNTVTEKPTDSNDEYLKLRNFFNLNSNIFSQYIYQYQTFSYGKNKTISFNPRIPSPNNSAVLDLSYARQSESAGGNKNFYGNGNAYVNINGAFPPTNNAVYYRGNPGSAMLRKPIGENTYYPYDYYVETDEFKNNLKTLTNAGDTVVMNVTVNGIIADTNKIFKLPDYPYSNYANKDFTMKEVTYDIMQNTTTLKLVSI